MRFIWFISGGFVLLLAVIGIFLPLLPTVPFLLLAAFCFAKSSERAHQWLINHKSLGPPIKDWQESGAIQLSAKRMATVFIVLAFSISLILGVSPMILGIQAAVLGCVLVFIWSRPNA